MIDEAHKLPDAARQMYGQSLSAEDFRELCDLLAKEKYILAAQRLKEKFTALMGAMCRGELLEEAQRGNEDPDTLINGLLQAATEFTMQTVIYYRSGLGGRHWPEYL